MKTLNELKTVLSETKSEIAKVLIGQEDVIDLVLVTIMSGSHALIEGVPGIAKTLLVRTLARTMDCDSKRIQFTPDLMPSDIIGTNVFNLQKNEFNLVEGPVFTSLLLADEINRAPAKTQSALLQCMQERKVTIDGKDYQLDRNFTVFATLNPIEYEGTYPLPEAQKDRFLMMINMGYPERSDELELAKRMLEGNSPEKILDSGAVRSVISSESLPELQASLSSVVIREEIVNYIVEIVRRTRDNPAILAGASPRATQALVMSSRIYAVLNGRDFVTPDDIKALAGPVLCHRIIIRPEFEIEGLDAKNTVKQVIEAIAVPR